MRRVKRGADGVVSPAKRFAELTTTPALRATPPFQGGEKQTLLDFEFQHLDAGCADVAQPARDSRFLPIEFSGADDPSAIRAFRDGFHEFAAVQNNPQAGRVCVIGNTD